MHQCNQPRNATPLNQVHPKHEWLGLDEINRKAPDEISRQKQPKRSTFWMWALVVAIQGERQQSKKEDLIKLRRMTCYAVAKVYSSR